jgi:hypothetical protein
MDFNLELPIQLLLVLAVAQTVTVVLLVLVIKFFHWVGILEIMETVVSKQVVLVAVNLWVAEVLVAAAL